MRPSDAKPGDKVRALAKAQELTPGKLYTVTAVDRLESFFGRYTTLTVEDGVRSYVVRNPDAVLEVP